MPMQKLLYIEKYEAMLNGAMKYSLEFDTPNEEIIGFMAYIGKSQNCDRFYIFEDSTHGEFTSNTYEWCAPGITAEKDRLQKVEKSTLIEHEFVGKTVGWCRQQFIAVDRDEHGHILHAIYTTEVINDAKKRENHLRYLAQTDMLTGLNNRGSGE